MQTSVLSSMAVGLPGQIADIGNALIETFVNGSRQLDEVTITAADAATTLTINGTAVTVNSGAETKTKAELVALLKAAVNAASLGVTASDGSASDKMYVRADVHGTGFTAVGTTNCSVAHKVLNEGTIPFGKAVVRDTWSGLERSAHLPSLTAEVTTLGVFLGVTVHSHANEQNITNANNPGYAAYSAMSVMRRGRIWVTVETAVSPGDQAYVRFSADTSAGESLGSFRNDADTADAVALPHSTFESSAAAGGIALLNLGGTVI
jgi:hypothetical protein